MNKKELQALKDQLEGKVEEVGFEILDLEFFQSGKDRILRFYIYRPEGVGIDECEKVSQVLSPLLDQLDPISSSYLLEVSSPDLSRPMKTDREFQIRLGEDLEFTFYSKFQGKKQWIARLIDFDQEKFRVKITNSKGNEEEQVFDRSKVASVKPALIF